MKELFNFYGLLIEIVSDVSDIVEQVRRDFAYFKVPKEDQHPDEKILLHLSMPPYETLPSLKASFFTPRNVCFKLSKTTYIDYFGKGLVVFDRQKHKCSVYSADQDLVHEIAYLFILSTVGKYLDIKGIHRIHALGVSYKRIGILLLLPSGGGKSTMALELLKNPDYFLLSEDTPFIDRHGRILPFPLRIGVSPGTNTGIPAKFLRTVCRMEFDPKMLIDIEYFSERLGRITKPGLMLVGERNLGTESAIVPISKTKAFKALLKYMVVGLGIYQGLEFLLERGIMEIIGKADVVASRLNNSFKLLSSVNTYKFVLGRNTEKNYETLVAFIDKTLG